MPAFVTTDVDTAAGLLRAGKLVAIPTETVYGLGGNAIDERAVADIFAAKDRPAFDPLIIHQASADRLFAYASDVPPQARMLAEAFWPGALTLVLSKAASVPDLVTAGLPTVAMRVPDHPLTLDLLQKLDFPVAAPSANPFGFVSPTTARHVLDQLRERIPAVLDGGPCRVGLESTIVGFPGGQPTVYRKGGLPIEDIERQLGCRVAVREHGDSRPAAPGMLSKHYAPGCKIWLVESTLAWPPLQNLPGPFAFVHIGRNRPENKVLHGGLVHHFNLSPTGDLAEAAANLFKVLRRLNQLGVSDAVIELAPERGLGSAINDRLRRAAAT